VPPVDLEDIGEPEFARIFIALTMAEARAAEVALDARGIRYVVQAEPIGRTLFGLPRHLAVFYVAAGDADTCAALLAAAGLEGGVIKE
jgi:hypothetical protein